MRVAVRNAADRRQVSKAGVRDDDRINQDLDDFKRIAQLDFGRRFIYHILEMTGEGKKSFTGNSETFFNEGQRSVGLMLIKEFKEVSKEHYLTMLNENIGRYDV